MANPLVCDPIDKADLEARNGVGQIDLISFLVNERRIKEIRESHIFEFHKIAIQDIYPCGGEYRDAGHHVVIRGSDHVLPDAARVPGLIRDLVEELNSSRGSRSAMERSALALWRFNWIHPFKGGNGRSARALSYLVICMDMGLVPPGLPQVPTLIYQVRDKYIEGLTTADKSVRDGNDPDLSVMSGLVEDVVTKQLASAIKSLGVAPDA